MAKETPHTGSATIEQLLEMSLDKLQSMSDTEVLAFLQPALIAQPPESSSFSGRAKTKGTGKPSLGFKKAPTSLKLSLGKKKKGKSDLFLELQKQQKPAVKLTPEEKKKKMFAEMASLAGTELPDNMK